jgi:hypothetical protein
MLFGDLLKVSFEALRAHKLRTTLTILGIVIGVTSVIAIISIVVGMNDKFESLISRMGTTTFTVSKFGIDDYASDDAFREARRRKNLRYRERLSFLSRGWRKRYDYAPGQIWLREDERCCHRRNYRQFYQDN